MKAIVLLSGGLDSTVMLAMAIHRGRDCHALSFDYGQRHRIELESAKAVVKHYGIPHQVIHIDPSTFQQSALLSDDPVPENRHLQEISQQGVPSTYVPARNTLFIAYAIGQAEILKAQEIYIGCNALDQQPYPDCRIEYLHAFQRVIDRATRQAVEGNAPRLVAPLIEWDKGEIFRWGRQLKAPIHLTWSCYNPTPSGKACCKCDACVLRATAE